ncbi:AraC family transcriptional regulator [Acetobacteraceae bacterium KSS8]|uniref:AraC family transcriptional regulator n=1 Tax=Endosaccharibacter trunci TaxID=2812733 RepID=A0ABT1W4B4_9PROT|nr:AraC family transcriptional regulator [Acetobacteraceae bacterium KSS8]
MQLATRWLSAGRVPIDVLAERLGYTSQAAFSRAFKRITGASPTSGRPSAAP